MAQAEDMDILVWAREHGYIVITLDADFHAILAVTGADAPSVIRVRMQGLQAEALATLVQKIVERYRAELSSGCMLTVKKRKTTCHVLPVGSGNSLMH
jgi:predicted nuclease of predicted toxin-antitoxin system